MTSPFSDALVSNARALTVGQHRPKNIWKRTRIIEKTRKTSVGKRFLLAEETSGLPLLARALCTRIFKPIVHVNQSITNVTKKKTGRARAFNVVRCDKKKHGKRTTQHTT